LYLGHQYTPHFQWHGNLAEEALAVDRSAATAVLQHMEASLPHDTELSVELRALAELEEEAAGECSRGAEDEEDFDSVDFCSLGLDSP
jgi:hypothetical protein